MFVGHYAPSFGLRRLSSVPLWALFLAAQFVDVLWAVLVMLGIERVRIVPGYTSASPLALDYMPYSHSLSATLVWALLAGILGAAIWDRRGGAVLGACVLGHWILDLLVHVPDLPLVGNQHKVGLGLWNDATLSFVVEAALLLGMVAVYVRGARRTLPVWLFAFAMLGMQASAFILPLPASSTELAAMALANYAGLSLVAALVERHWGVGSPRLSLRERVRSARRPAADG
jgi:hypothetical protein